MKKWQYYNCKIHTQYKNGSKVITSFDGKSYLEEVEGKNQIMANAPPLDEYLNNLGLEGWELVATTMHQSGTVEYFFKRPLN